MTIHAHEPVGFEGQLVSVEVDIRRGIPAVDVVGLAEGAVREARERVRTAARNAGFEFPLDRVLVNLFPAGLRKEGAAYDLPIALAILGAAGQLPAPGRAVLALGELQLDGSVHPVRGILPALASASRVGIRHFVVPRGNLEEALALGSGYVHPMSSISESLKIFEAIRRDTGSEDVLPPQTKGDGDCQEGDFAELRGLPLVRRAMEIAAAGGHNVLLFGPPGAGKTLAARRFGSLLPDLDRRQSIESTSLHSLANSREGRSGLLRRPPFRSPHHGASFEGMIGGGRRMSPGEVSLSHNGVLFLDEAPEFRRDVLQALREPLEDRRVSIARAGATYHYPASFILIMAANPCPCGNLGRRDKVCLCSTDEVARHWRRLGAALLDRIDIRVPVRPGSDSELLGPGGASSAEIRTRVEAARERQRARAKEGWAHLNAHLLPSQIAEACRLDSKPEKVLMDSTSRLELSSRGLHSVLRVARTIADLGGHQRIRADDIVEAVQHRRHGDGDFRWPEDGISLDGC